MTDAFIDWLRAWGELSLGTGIALAALFVVASFVFFPRTFLYLGVGIVFGLATIPIAIPATTVGGALSFLLSRYLLADRVQAAVARRPRLRAISEAVDSEGWRLVALLRLAAPLPNSVVNYILGITRIGFWPYTLATLVFTIPQTVLYIYLGAAGRAALIDDASSPASRALLVLGAVCLAATAFLIWRKARLALRQLESANIARSS